VRADRTIEVVAAAELAGIVKADPGGAKLRPWVVITATPGLGVEDEKRALRRTVLLRGAQNQPRRFRMR